MAMATAAAMTPSTVDMNTLNSLLAGLELDSVFNEIQQQQQQQHSGAGVRSAVPQLTQSSRPPLVSSLSVPSDAFYSDPLTPWLSEDAAGAAAAPKLSAERRALSLGSDSQPVTSPARYKTELCRPYEENGTCRYGSKCQFAHGRAELRTVVRHPKYKTDLCRTFHTTGLCPYGPRCHFIHNDEERRGATGAAAESARDELARRRALVHSNPDEPVVTSGGRLQRQYSERQPRVSADPFQTGHHVELQRRSSSVADRVIRHHQHPVVPPPTPQLPLQSLSEVDYSSNNVAKSARSLGSVADSFSPSSSVTGSPSPSPTAGLLIPPSTPAPEEPQSGMVVPCAWPAAAVNAEDDRQAVADLVSRLRPQELATLVRLLSPPSRPAVQGPPGTIAGGFNAPGLSGHQVDVAGTWAWQNQAAWSQSRHHQQQNHHHHHHSQPPATGNVCSSW